MTPTKKSDCFQRRFSRGIHIEFCGICRSCVEFTENAWNSPSSAEFTKRRGIHGKDVEFIEMAWNSRYGMESAGVVLVMWAVAE